MHELQLTTLVPSWFWIAAGIVFVTNLGTFGTLLTFIWRASWWASKIDSRIEKAQETGVRAHKRIDKVETNLNQPRSI